MNPETRREIQALATAVGGMNARLDKLESIEPHTEGARLFKEHIELQIKPRLERLKHRIDTADADTRFELKALEMRLAAIESELGPSLFKKSVIWAKRLFRRE